MHFSTTPYLYKIKILIYAFTNQFGDSNCGLKFHTQNIICSAIISVEHQKQACGSCSPILCQLVLAMTHQLISLLVDSLLKKKRGGGGG